MSRTLPFALAALAVLAGAPLSQAQEADWSPPSRQMPMMPLAGELDGDWLTTRSGWFQGVERASGAVPARLSAVGEIRSGSERLQIARFLNGPVPAVVWSDRNGDDRADLIEIFKSGGVIIQLIDADYDGNSNVIRIYDASGALVRERRM